MRRRRPGGRRGRRHRPGHRPGREAGAGTGTLLVRGDRALRAQPGDLSRAHQDAAGPAGRDPAHRRPRRTRPAAERRRPSPRRGLLRAPLRHRRPRRLPARDRPAGLRARGPRPGVPGVAEGVHRHRAGLNPGTPAALAAAGPVGSPDPVAHWFMR
ncbi:hypothetical protein SCOCK_300002 [Actinacidiphila cocklensis]|uniref:Uncharacterized protein n=1 Tax=Actinacidiphila cocklensis TaxID=887465 RepID=A0A9W4GTZ9_9ACTN|nr:hypothetical protein SCOCK_300002 [Actinacidiphila cocklensis]